MWKSFIGFVAGIISSGSILWLFDAQSSSLSAGSDKAEERAECSTEPEIIEKRIIKTPEMACPSVVENEATIANDSERIETSTDLNSSGDGISDTKNIIDAENVSDTEGRENVTFQNEPIDSSWAYTAEQSINQALTEVMTENGAVVDKVNCRSNSCVLRIHNLSENDSHKLVARTLEVVLVLDWVPLDASSFPAEINLNSDSDVFEICVRRNADRGCHDWQTLE